MVEKFKLPGTGLEGVVAEDATAINWLKLRFGGESFQADFNLDELRQFAMDLPPGPIIRDISSQQIS